MGKALWSSDGTLNSRGLTTIRYLIGKILFVDNSFQKSPVQSVACLLVKVDINLSFSKFLELVFASQRYTELLYYVNIPFRCVRCHICVNVFASCDKPITRKVHCKNNYVKVVNKENNNLSLFSEDKISDSKNVL